MIAFSLPFLIKTNITTKEELINNFITAKSYNYIKLNTTFNTSEEYSYEANVGVVNKNKDNVVGFSLKNAEYFKANKKWYKQENTNNTIPGSAIDLLKKDFTNIDILNKTTLTYDGGKYNDGINECKNVYLEDNCKIIQYNKVDSKSKDYVELYYSNNVNYPKVIVVKNKTFTNTYFVKNYNNAAVVSSLFNNLKPELDKSINDKNFIDSNAYDENFSLKQLTNQEYIKTYFPIPQEVKSNSDNPNVNALFGFIILSPFITFNLLLAVIVLDDNIKNKRNQKYLWPFVTIFGGLFMFIFYFAVIKKINYKK